MDSSSLVEDTDTDGYVYGGVVDGFPTVLFGSLLNTLARFEKEDEEAREREELSPDLISHQLISPVSTISRRYRPSSSPARHENCCSQTMPGNRIFEPKSTKRKSSDMSDAPEEDLQYWLNPQKQPKLHLRGGRGSSSPARSSTSTSTTEFRTPEDVDAALQAQLNSEEETTPEIPTPKDSIDKSAVNNQSVQENRLDDTQKPEEEQQIEEENDEEHTELEQESGEVQQSEQDEPIGEVDNEDRGSYEEPQSNDDAQEKRKNNRPPQKLKKKSRLVTIKIVLAPTIKVESDDEDQSSSTSYVVEGFRADRRTPTGLEILVEWQDYPDKEHWTWESEEQLLERVPELVTAWHARALEEDNEDNDNAKDFMIMEVDEIVGRRKKKGTFWYNVSWKGYPLKRDRTWEPYETLHADVPFLVEAYDQKSRKSSKRKR